MTFSILAFDTATNTGVCYGRAGETPRAWSVSLGKVAWEARFSKTLRMTAHYIREYKPDLVAVEAFVGGPKANTDLAGLVACVKGEAHRLGVPVVSYYPATIRKHFLGTISRKNPIPIKSQVYNRCKLLGWHVPDLDAADALALFDYAMAIARPAHAASNAGMFGVIR